MPLGVPLIHEPYCLLGKHTELLQVRAGHLRQDHGEPSEVCRPRHIIAILGAKERGRVHPRVHEGLKGSRERLDAEGAKGDQGVDERHLGSRKAWGTPRQPSEGVRREGPRTETSGAEHGRLGPVAAPEVRFGAVADHFDIVDPLGVGVDRVGLRGRKDRIGLLLRVVGGRVIRHDIEGGQGGL